MQFDDNPLELAELETTLSKQSVGPIFKVTSYMDPEKLLMDLGTMKTPDLAVLDVYLNDKKIKNHPVGFDLARAISKQFDGIVIVMRSSLSDTKTVIESLKAGADDFISKSTGHGELSLRLLHSLELARHKRGDIGDTPSNPKASTMFYGQTMQGVSNRVQNILKSAIQSIHIVGEPGTGKEVVADVFKAHIETNVPFIKVNCGAITPSLMESELFGHVKGAFSGATQDRKGLFAEAHNGWIFLDEIATLTEQAQAALLRVIENQEIKPVGASKNSKIKVRLISATNEKLEELVKKGTFRKDLWQRLMEVTLALPPLRDRPAEIPGLIEYFCKTMEGGPYKITEPAKKILSALQWKDGNIRELRNCIRAMTEYHKDKTLNPVAIPQRVLKELEGFDNETEVETDVHNLGHQKLTLDWDPESPAGYEGMCNELLIQMIRHLGENGSRLSIRRLAKILNMPRSSLSDKLKMFSDQNLLDKNELKNMLGLEW